MNNFIFNNPTKIVFGKGTISQLPQLLPSGVKLMVTFGGGSVKHNGVYDQLVEALKGFDFIEFWGIEPNPTVESVREAVQLARENNIDFLLAVGGGSVVDATKLIAAAVHSQYDPWNLVRDASLITTTLPFASIITLPATGSEMNSASVISNKATDEKFAFYNKFPQFSILDPQTTFTLPEFQRACGLADTFVHVIEQYLTSCGHSPLMDRWAEGVMLTINELAPKVLSDPTDYDTMASFMLSATMALNGFISMGVPQDWATHRIGHELTALAGTTHGQALAIILPALMKVQSEDKKDKILQLGERVWGITEGSDEQRLDRTIARTREFFASLGLKTTLIEVGCDQKMRAEIVERFRTRGTRLGENGNVEFSRIEKILELCK